MDRSSTRPILFFWAPNISLEEVKLELSNFVQKGLQQLNDLEVHSRSSITAVFLLGHIIMLVVCVGLVSILLNKGQFGV